MRTDNDIRKIGANMYRAQVARAEAVKEQMTVLREYEKQGFIQLRKK